MKVKVKLLSPVRLYMTPWTVAYQAPLSIGFSRQEYWSGLPFAFPGDLPYPGIKAGLPHCRQTLYHLSHQGSPGNSCIVFEKFLNKIIYLTIPCFHMYVLFSIFISMVSVYRTYS